MKKVLLLITLIILCTSLVWAAEPESKTISVPIIASSPETGVMLGGMAIYLKKEEQEKLKVDLGAMYTQEKQTNIFLVSNKDYNDKKIELVLSYQDWISKYYGIGNNTESVNEEDYDYEGFKVRGGFSKEILDNNYLGIITSYEDYNIGLDKNIVGIEGTAGVDLLGVGLSYSYDTRDRKMNTRDGQYFNYAVEAYNHDLTDYKFIKHEFDYRAFKEIYKHHVIGFQLMLELNCGEVPFQKLASLGDSRLMRGLLDGRYIDKNKFAAQLEYRYPIYKKFDGIVFASLGEVYNQDFDIDELKESYGLGVRYNLDQEEGINLRLDMAFGDDDTKVYVTLGEAF
jgi:outer membrane protein assembly factor BamA